VSQDSPESPSNLMAMKLLHARALIYVLSLLSALGIAERAEATRARAAVVRVEAAVDPVSAGPGLVAELSARERVTPYQEELARRLRIGSTGTGFIVNSRGDVVTNAHVVLSGVRFSGLHFTYAEWDSMARLLTGVRDIWVTMGEGEEERDYLATPIAVAEDLDLALLRLARPPGDDTPMPYLPMADSDQLSVGEEIRALGFAENGYQDSSGAILSLIRGTAVHGTMQLLRHVDPHTGEEILTVSGTSPGFIGRLQHSAPVGHGSSGGPIIDTHGRVVGVAYALLANRAPEPEEDLGLAGLNLAIASNVVKQLLRRYSVPFAETHP
jgi:S1-C subfamily serine protease